MIRVLVIDDSAVMRQALTLALGAERDLEVQVAPDALIGWRKLTQRRPDVVILDLVLPGMGGEQFLAEVMARAPVPVVVCSGVAGRGTERALAALRVGAVDVVNKPTVSGAKVTGVQALVDAVRAAAGAKVGQPRPVRVAVVPVARGLSRRVVAVGASTGGTEALRTLLAAMPADGPPMLIVQHMPEPFATAFARSLQEATAMTVRQAQHGEGLRDGVALVSPGDRHLRLARLGGVLRVQLEAGPPICRHRPSVTALFLSVAEAAGAQAVGVLLTGMGSDGADGMVALRAAGAWTIAQSEESCVVYGMPREAVRLGGACESLALEDIAARAVEMATRA